MTENVPTVTIHVLANADRYLCGRWVEDPVEVKHRVFPCQDCANVRQAADAATVVWVKGKLLPQWERGLLTSNDLATAIEESYADEEAKIVRSRWDRLDARTEREAREAAMRRHPSNQRPD